MTPDRPRVLYVDDNRLDRELVHDALASAPTAFELIEAATADEFESAFRDSSFDVVLTDFNICGFEGFQVLARVHDHDPELPVIIVTGTGSEEIAVEAMKSGAADYIIKSPSSISRLPASIESVLRSRRLSREKAQAEWSLRESEARLHRAVVRAPVPVMIHAEDGEILAVSDIWFELTGYTRSELTTVSEWVERAHGERAAEVLAAIARTFEAKAPLDAGEFAIRCADGSHRIWGFRSTPLGTLPNGPRFAMTVASDVTEHRSLEAQLRQSQKLEAVGRLAGGVAHDFNNMLQVILGYASLAIDEMGPQAEVPNWLAMIMEAANRSANLTRQLLAFARIQTIEPRRVKLDEALTGIVKLLSRIVEEHVTLTCEVSADTWDVEIDPAQLDSVVANLVINARDAIEDSGRITVRAKPRTVGSEADVDLPPGDYVEITVEDSGTGIAPVDVDQVFQPFFTTKEQSIGTGLGLATVYGIVHQNGGSITVTSELGAGSMFVVLLPRYAAETRSRKAAEHRQVWSGDGCRVLLVEDDDAVLRITKRLLSDLGFHVTATGDPAHAIELVQEDIGPLDLVMTDVVMPGVSGPELVEEIRKTLPDIPVLFTSGYPAGTVSSHGVLREGVHFISKPFSRAKLAEKIAEALAAEEDCNQTNTGDHR